MLSKRILLYLRDQIAQCLWIADRFMIQYSGSYCDIILIVISSGRILAKFVARKQNYNGQTYNIYVSNLVKPRKRTILLNIVATFRYVYLGKTSTYMKLPRFLRSWSVIIFFSMIVNPAPTLWQSRAVQRGQQLQKPFYGYVFLQLHTH